MTEKKSNAGRPPKFTNVENMDKLIDKYFKSLIGVDSEGKEYSNPATITGLALALGFCDKCSLYDYSDKPEFSHSLKRARMMVECDYETRLAGKASTGAIFALKNFGWKDKVEVDNNHSGTMSVQPVINFSSSSKKDVHDDFSDEG
jgi:hypothetical protein